MFELYQFFKYNTYLLLKLKTIDNTFYDLFDQILNSIPQNDVTLYITDTILKDIFKLSNYKIFELLYIKLIDLNIHNTAEFK